MFMSRGVDKFSIGHYSPIRNGTVNMENFHYFIF